MQADVDNPRMAARAVPLLVLSAGMFGAMAVLTRSLAEHVPTMEVATLRFCFGLASMAVLAVTRRNLFVITRPFLLALRGILGGLSVLGYFYSLQYLPAGTATLLNYTFPVWTAVWAALFLGERLTLQLVGGMLLSLVGLTVVVEPMTLWQTMESGHSQVGLGVLVGFVASVSAGGATTTIRALRRTDSAAAIFTAFSLFGLLLSLPVALPVWVPVPPALWPRLLLVGALSLGAQFIFTWSMRYVSAARGGMMQQLTVVASYTLAWLTLGESVGLQVQAGALLVIGGVIYVNREQAPARP